MDSVISNYKLNAIQKKFTLNKIIHLSYCIMDNGIIVFTHHDYFNDNYISKTVLEVHHNAIELFLGLGDWSNRNA